MKLDVLVIKRLREKFLCGCESDKHIISFMVRLVLKQKMCVQYNPPVKIKDKDICQHYLEEVPRRTDLFGNKCITKWNKKTAAAKTWSHPATFFEKRIKEKEDFETLGDTMSPSRPQ